MLWFSGITECLRWKIIDGWRFSILSALPVAICAYLVALALERPSGQYSSFDNISYLIIAVTFFGFYCLLFARRWTTTTTVMAVIIVVYCQFIGKLIYLLYFNPHTNLTQAEFTETFFWIPVLFVLSAFIPGLERGRLVVVVFFTLFSALSVSFVVPNLITGRNFGIVYALIEMILANVTLLTLTHNFLNFKENLAKTSARAETLKRLAYQDPLTGLPNRLALEQDLQALILTRQTSKIAVVFIDIDGFKLINDTRGHSVGDEMLRRFADRLNLSKREGDLVFRISGDEFVVILADLPNEAEPLHVVERIRLALTQPFEFDGIVTRISTSIGVALYPDNGTTTAALLKHADAAMYTVKHSGKDGIALYDTLRDDLFEERALLVSELQQALQEEQLKLYYQPIVDLHIDRPKKVEALMRWHSPTRGAIPPVKFIALAEEHGLITQLGSYALKTACAQIETWKQQGLDDVAVSVNVSAHQLQDPDFAQSVKTLLQLTGVEPSKLELELTESTVIQAVDQVTATFQALRKLGVSIALDDFGTGYSSLSYLETLDFDTIKIDRSFATKLTHARKDPQYSVAIIRAVLEIASTLDVQVVAEGIETKEQVEIFRSLGCRLLQGYYFGKPMPAEEVTILLQPLVQTAPKEHSLVVN